MMRADDKIKAFVGGYLFGKFYILQRLTKLYSAEKI